MTETLVTFPNPFEALQRLDTLMVGPTHGILLSADGEVEDHSLADLRILVRDKACLVCNTPLTLRRLGLKSLKAFDVLELFAFIRPAHFCLPLPLGLARALNLPATGDTLEDTALLVQQSAHRLLQEIQNPDYAYPEGAIANALKMAESGWNWGPLILGALGVKDTDRPYNVWDHLSEWEEGAPQPPAGSESISVEETLSRLHSLLGPDSEERPGQKDYAAHICKAFNAPEDENEPALVLAEAGTGIGKTLGYIAPASLWAEKNDGTVWLATFTKNLQRQLDQELDRLYPDPDVKKKKAVVRKGRENYLCLLNLQELSQTAAQPQGRILLGLISRWARYSRDGDMIGGDFPAWLGENFGNSRLAQLTDRRGECVYSACAHYRKCFIEKAVRNAKKADLVIANHALVMVQAVTRAGDPDLPSRYVFDEGHHLFDAADSAFSAHLTGQEGLELRRWIRGAEISGRRGKGLKGRLEDLISDDEEARACLEKVITAARCLPAEGWHARLMENAPFGPTEKFLSSVRHQVKARSTGRDMYHSLEVSADNPIDGLIEAADHLAQSLEALCQPLKSLSSLLLKKIDAEADQLDSTTRARLDNVSRTITRRADLLSGGWLPMLAALKQGKNELFVDWFELNRSHGTERDTGMHRHWIDPSLPFSETVLKPAQGALITSATLRDRLTDNHNPDIEWHAAEIRTGAAHMINPPLRHSVASPFDYANNSKIFIVTDINKQNLDHLASAYRELFLASGGGALGLFTAISRLRGVYERLITPMEDHNLSLYAQHVDPINVSTLVDIFREMEDSCLLGTDAVRDGVDVPGRSLRLCVFDRVPWPRPTILHKARREIFGKKTYDELITRLRLKQAYGRLIRRATDKGVFVMLDGATPTRLLSAFPQEVSVERVGLAEAIEKTRAFLVDEPRNSPDLPDK